MLSVTRDDAVSPPLASVAIAVTVNAVEATEAGTEAVNPLSWPVLSVQLPSPLFVPADKVTPPGMPEITIDRLSEPSVSVSAVVMFKAIVALAPDAVITSLPAPPRIVSAALLPTIVSAPALPVGF